MDEQPSRKPIADIVRDGQGSARIFTSCVFTNELGNRIRIQVERSDTDITIRVIGPMSESENVLTPLEAARLHETLGESLAYGS